MKKINQIHNRKHNIIWSHLKEGYPPRIKGKKFVPVLLPPFAPCLELPREGAVKVRKRFTLPCFWNRSGRGLTLKSLEEWLGVVIVVDSSLSYKINCYLTLPYTRPCPLICKYPFTPRVCNINGWGSLCCEYFGISHRKDSHQVCSDNSLGQIKHFLPVSHTSKEQWQVGNNTTDKHHSDHIFRYKT